MNPPQVRHAIKVRDGKLLMAMLLPAMGIFELTDKHNLKRQCYWQLLKLITCSEETALQIMTGVCLNTTREPKAPKPKSGEPSGGEPSGSDGAKPPITGRAADDVLETTIGTGKMQKEGAWTKRSVRVKFTNLDVNHGVRVNFEVLVGSARDDSSHWDARDEAVKAEVAPAFQEIFTVPRRVDGSLQPRRLDALRHRLMSVGFVVPSRWRKLLNLVGRPTTEAQPVLQAARRCATRLEADMAAAEPSLLPEHVLPADLQGGVGHVAADALPPPTHCDVCGGEFEFEPIVCTHCSVRCADTDDEPNRICAACCILNPVSDEEEPLCRPCFQDIERQLAVCDGDE